MFEDNFPYEEIFIARMNNDRWEKATNISDVINTPFFESSLTISENGPTKMFLFQDTGWQFVTQTKTFCPL